MERLTIFARRAAAYLTDSVGIFLYAVGLAAVMLLSGAEIGSSKLVGYALAFLTLTAPVVLLFSVMEARWGATPGKALLGLRVTQGQAGAGLGQALTRNVVKFLPWELAHIGIWMTPGQPFVDAPAGISLVLIVMSYALILVQAVLVLAFKAGLHDLISGLRVARR
jgi:uncharacterized RDD family membrane protein YckC